MNIYVLLRDRDRFEWGRRWSVVGSWRDRQRTQTPTATKKRPVATRSRTKTFYVFWMWIVNSRRRSFLSSKTLAGQHDNHTGHTNTPEDTLHTHRLSVTHNNTHRFSHTLVVWCVGRISTLFISLFWKLLNKLQNWKLIENELRRARRRSKFFGLRRWKKFVNKRTNEVGESSIGVSWLARTVSSTTLPSAAQLGTIAAEDGWAK